jgi:hypothetical protein
MAPAIRIVKRNAHLKVFRTVSKLMKNPVASSSLAVEDHSIGDEKRCAMSA